MNVLGMILAGVLAFIGQIVYFAYRQGVANRDHVGQNGYSWHSTAEEVAEGVDMSGKVALVTGANSGLGFETARVFALKGAHVVVVARSIAKATDAIARVEKSLPAGSKPNMTPLACELSSLGSVDKAAKAFKALKLPLHFLVANAGIMGLPERATSADGYELQVATNHLGHFHLVTSLLDTMVASAPARVVLLSSVAHESAPDPRTFLESDTLEMPYSPWGTYADSKLTSIIFAKELNERYKSKGVLGFSVAPGMIYYTNLGRYSGLKTLIASLQVLADRKLQVFNMVALLGRSIPQGAATQVYAALKAPESEAGLYLDKCNVQAIGKEYKSQRDARLLDNAPVRAKFWATSEKLVKQALEKL